MPRSPSGVYTLPEAPFVSGTVISSTDVNNNFSDLGDAMTDSLSRDGEGGMTAALQLDNAGFFYLNDPDTGMYRKTANTQALKAAGIDIAVFSPDGMDLTGDFSATGDGAFGGDFDVTGTSHFGGVPDFDAPNWLTLANMANLTHGRFIGRLSAGDGVPEATAPAFGQCQFIKQGANLALVPFDGNLLTINGNVETVPDSGLTVAPPATNGILYFAYAYMVAGVMTLEVSTTVPVAQASTGIKIKTGDATRSLVGMARTVSSAWVLSATQGFVRSWFNDPALSVSNFFTAGRSVSSPTYVEIDTEIRIEFLTWTGETPLFVASGGFSNNSASAQFCLCSIAIDGIVAEDVFNMGTSSAPNYILPLGLSLPKGSLSQGYHYATLVGLVSSGTGTWQGGSTVGQRTTLKALFNRP